MKTRNLFMYVVVAIVFIATSCEKDSDGDPKLDPIVIDSVIDNPITDADTIFADLTVEESKTYIEDQGVQMLDDMKALEDEPAIQTNITLAQLLNTSVPIGGAENAKIHPSESLIFAPVYATANYKQTGLKGLAKLVEVNPAGDPNSFQEVFDENIGIYKWNSVTDEWDYTATGDKIVLLFPSEENGTTNNASYTVSYTGYTGPNPIKDSPDSEYTGDLPQNFSAKLVVDAIEVSAYLLDIVYNSDGYPTSITTSLSLGEYVLSAMAANEDNKAFKTVESFKKGSEILLQFGLEAKGDWSQENIDANYSEETKYYYGYYDEETWEWVEVEVGENDEYTYSETDVEFDLHKVVTGGNASFQVLNLKVVGNIDAEKLGDKMKEIDATYDWETQEEAAVAAQVTAVNEFVSLTLRFADNNQIIAMVEAYPTSEENIYYNYVYNENTGIWEEIQYTETEYYMDLRFVFVDGSKVDSETYFDDTFSDLKKSFQDYQKELEDTYGFE